MSDKKSLQKNTDKKQLTKTFGAPKEINQMVEIEQVRDEIKEKYDCLSGRGKKLVLESIGVGNEYLTCQRCGRVLAADDFYTTSASGIKTRKTHICKDCASAIALGENGEPTKESVDRALYALDKPFLDSIWEASLLEAANSTNEKSKSNVWTSYIKNIAMQQYATYTYRNSDNYNGGIISLDDMAQDALPKDQEIIQQFEKNKNDVFRLIGYYPFEKEALSDQPFLYAQLVGFLDASEEGNDDMMRVSSIISIVRNFLQLNRLDDRIAAMMKTPQLFEQNTSDIKASQTMKKELANAIAKLAEESCISLKHSKNSTKGANTWTGKIKSLKDLDLREARTNGFDLSTCRGMQQVQEISDASIMKQLALDESEYSDMIAELRQKRVDLERDIAQYKEINRILLQENLDLKDYLESVGDFSKNDTFVNLKDLYAQFSTIEDVSEEVDSDDTTSSE